MPRNLKSTTFSLAQGLRTQYDPASNEGQGLLMGRNADGFDEFRSVGKTPGSTRVSASFSGPVSSLHQFEFFDLDKVQRRLQIGFRGDTGSGYLIDPSTGAITLITHYGAVGLANEPLCEVQMGNTLFLSSPNSWQPTTGGLLYDGNNCTGSPPTPPTCRAGTVRGKGPIGMKERHLLDILHDRKPLVLRPTATVPTKTRSG